MDNRPHPPIGRDLLTDLPLDIIETILIDLPIRDAIRTSVLSSNWRYIWTRLPRLHFIIEQDMVSLENRDEAKSFVDSTLSCHQGPIQRFVLYVKSMHSCQLTDQWFILLSRKDIQELLIHISRRYPYFDVPYCLYLCQNLTSLYLVNCRVHPPPTTFKGFPYLRNLNLENGNVSSDTFKSIVDGSPLLENLECENSGCAELRICAPNLKYFYVRLNFHQDLHLSAPLLAEIDIGHMYNNLELQQEHPIYNYQKFFGGLMKLERLCISAYIAKYMSAGIKHCQHHGLVLPHLKTIALCYVDLQVIEETMLYVRLIMAAAASLTHLEVRCEDDASKDSEAHHTHFWDSEWVRNCTIEKLEVVEISGFSGTLQEMKFIHFLLGSSPMLEKMTLKPINSQKLTVLNSIEEFSGDPRASPSAKIVVL